MLVMLLLLSIGGKLKLLRVVKHRDVRVNYLLHMLGRLIRNTCAVILLLDFLAFFSCSTLARIRVVIVDTLDRGP